MQPCIVEQSLHILCKTITLLFFFFFVVVFFFFFFFFLFFFVKGLFDYSTVVT